MTGAPSGTRDRGFVLVNALVLVAALSLLALQVMNDAMRSAGIAQVARMQAQGELLTDAALLFVGRLLSEDLAESRIDHIHERWSLSNYPAESAAGTVWITVRDLDRAFNLNTLAGSADAATVAGFERLANGLDLPPPAVMAILDHFGASRPVDSASAGDNFDDADLIHLGGLLQLDGVTPGDVRKLSQMATALPRATFLNVNTAPAGVLAAMLNLSEEDLLPLISGRAKAPFADAGAFLAAVAALYPATPAATGAIPVAAFGVSSSWFEVETRAQVDSLMVRRKTVIHRDPATGQIVRAFQEALDP
ncbi:MAG: type II secretion system minor pseudopilin GspK [Marinibacterium sp.]